MPITDVKKLRKSPGFLLRCAHQLSVAIVAEHLTQLNLTSVQFATLVAVNDHPGLDATRLAAMINFDRPTLTGVIDRLETKGLLVREPDLNDRRARQLFLTPDGEKMLAAADRAAHKSRDVLLDPLSPVERKQFMLLLEKLVDLHLSHSPSVHSEISGK
uniref:Nicotinate degradation protein R n=1 Tax=Sym plasmid TaxID=28430 RepID=A0A515HIF9_9ZZZZ|nr:Nicotinate degradation protein R [Sym plasmid]